MWCEICCNLWEEEKGFGCRLSSIAWCKMTLEISKRSPNDALQKQKKFNSIRRFLINFFFSLFVIYWRGHPLFASNSLVHGFGLESRDKRAKMKICNRRFLGLVFRQNAERRQRMNKLSIGCGAPSLRAVTLFLSNINWVNFEANWLHYRLICRTLRCWRRIFIALLCVCGMKSCITCR